MGNERIINSTKELCDLITWTWNHEKFSLNINSYVFKIDVDILQCLRENIEIDITPEHIFMLSFDNCVFEETFTFNWTVLDKVSFNKTIFKKDTFFSGAVFKGESVFDKAVFKMGTYFNGTVFENNTTFTDTVFEQKVSFLNSHLDGKIRFYRTLFKGDTNFDNSKFKDLADFWNATFYHKTIFHKTDFWETTVFSTTTFKENVLFTYTLINKLVIFRDTNFEKGLDLSLAIISGQISIFNINLSDFMDVKDTNDVEEFENNVSEKGVITRKNKRETFRILKMQLMSIQNNIDALHYYSFEMKSFEKQLHQDIFENKLYKNSLPNYLVLKLNRFSNKNGTSWLRGIVFTSLVGYLFFYLSIIATENYVVGFQNFNIDDFEKCFKYFFIFMLPTHNINYMDVENPTWLFYVIDFLGRIFVSYGIYQTIQAFRKYKSK